MRAARITAFMSSGSLRPSTNTLAMARRRTAQENRQPPGVGGHIHATGKRGQRDDRPDGGLGGTPPLSALPSTIFVLPLLCLALQLKAHHALAAKLRFHGPQCNPELLGIPQAGCPRQRP
ncbi:hypothetical protein [Streptomyces sp. NPDC006552]|uniref:hypothetical protein n=1 Tax=Streptomyces sp. NPDC006552 TaxID=3157179 RepID=UPI0033ABFBDA